MFPMLSPSSIRSLIKSRLRYRFDRQSDLLFIMGDSQDEKRENVAQGTAAKRIHRIELNSKVTEGRKR
jgi:hypothetical protein